MKWHVFKCDESQSQKDDRLFARQPHRPPRCIAFTQGPGAGYSGPHQCSFRSAAVYNGLPLCWTHLRRAVRLNETLKG